MSYIILFLCSMIIPVVNTSSISNALMSNEIDLIHSILSFGVFGLGIKYLKKNEHLVGIIFVVTIAEDFIINLFCEINYVTYIMQLAVIIIFAIYTKLRRDL